jgi:hypothetical protein
VELRFKFERRKDFPNCTVLYYEEVIWGTMTPPKVSA